MDAIQRIRPGLLYAQRKVDRRQKIFQDDSARRLKSGPILDVMGEEGTGQFLPPLRQRVDHVEWNALDRSQPSSEHLVKTTVGTFRGGVECFAAFLERIAMVWADLKDAFDDGKHPAGLDGPQEEGEHALPVRARFRG